MDASAIKFTNPYLFDLKYKPVAIYYNALSPNGKASVKKIFLFVGKNVLSKAEIAHATKLGLKYRTKGGKNKITAGAELDDVFDDIIKQKKDVIEKEKKKFKEDLIVIEDYINPDDNIRTIKTKIEYYTKIPAKYQHITYKCAPLGYDYSYTEKSSRKFYVDLGELELKYAKLINKKFTKKLKLGDIKFNDKSLDIRFCYTKGISLYDIRQIVHGMDTNLSIAPQDSLDLFYNGFIKLYFPFLEPKDIKLILERTNQQDPKIDEFMTKQKEYQEQINFLSSIPTTMIQDFSIGDTSMIKTNIHVNYNTMDQVTLNLYMLFDQFTMDSIVPYMRLMIQVEGVANTASKDLIVQKVYKDAKHANTQEWGKKKLKRNTLNLRMRISNDPNDIEYTKFANITISQNGRINITLSWFEGQNVNFQETHKKVFRMFDKVLDKINSLDALIFKNRRKKLRYSPENVQFESFNTISPVYYYPDRGLKRINYRRFKELIGLFPAFLHDNTDAYTETNVYNNIFTFYMRIPRESVVQFQTEEELAAEPIPEEEESEDYEKIVRLEINGDVNPKIYIKGIRNFTSLNYVYNFVARFIQIYSFFENSKPINKQFYDRYTSLTKNYPQSSPDAEDNIKYVNKNDFNLRQLQNIDSVTFNFHKNLSNKDKKKYKPYSRLCQQQDKHPIPFLSYKKAEYYMKKHRINNTYVLEYDNKTRPGEKVYYVCPHKIYKFPGFLDPDKHPQGICQVCCKKISSMDRKNIKNYNSYLNCLGKEGTLPPSTLSNPFYVKEYSGNKYLDQGKFGFLPHTLDKIFNKHTHCKVNEMKVLRPGSTCYLLVGIPRGKQPLWQAITFVLRLQPQDIFNKIDKLPLVAIKKLGYDSHNSLKTNITLYSEGNLWLSDLQVIQFFELILGPTSILILITETNGQVQLESSVQYKSLINSLQSPSMELTVLLKTNYKETLTDEQGIYIRPIIFVELHPDKGAFKKFKHSHKDLIAQELVKIFEDTISPKKIIGTHGAHPTLSNMLSLIHGKYKITAQIVKPQTPTKCNEIIITHGTTSFTFPIATSLPLKENELPIADSPNYGSYAIVYNFLKLLNALTKNNISIYKLIIFDNLLVGFLLSTRYTVYCVPTKLQSVTNLQKIPTKKIYYNPFKLMYYIDEGKQYEDDRTKNISELKYGIEIYELLRLELINILQNERNEEFEHYLIKRISTIHKFVGSEKKEILTDLKKHLKAEYERLHITDPIEYDYKHLKQVINTFVKLGRKKEVLQSSLDYFDFYYNKKSYYQLLNLFNADIPKPLKKDKLEKLLKAILGPLVKQHIRKIKATASNEQEKENVRKLCSDITSKNTCESLQGTIVNQCTFADNTCKLSIDPHTFSTNITRITEELLTNFTKRFEILNGTIDRVIDKNKFTQRATEVLTRVS
jgi:hypothetical protein